MIRTVRGKRTKAVLSGNVGKGFPPELVRRARLMLLVLDAAHALDDLRSPPGNRLEKLSGDLAGYHSIRINQQWRIVFRWHEGGASDVEIIDYH